MQKPLSNVIAVLKQSIKIGAIPSERRIAGSTFQTEVQLLIYYNLCNC